MTKTAISRTGLTSTRKTKVDYKFGIFVHSTYKGKSNCYFEGFSRDVISAEKMRTSADCINKDLKEERYKNIEREIVSAK